jgi:hypothetical protein
MGPVHFWIKIDSKIAGAMMKVASALTMRSLPRRKAGRLAGG